MAHSGDREIRYARLIGIDLLKAYDGQWWILEVNDVPSGLAQADDVCRTVPLQSRLGTNIVDSLARLLLKVGDGLPTLLLRPPKSALEEPKNDKELDYLAIENALRRLGGECIIVSPDCLRPDLGGPLYSGLRYGAVYRRTHVRPDCSPTGKTINPVAALFACRDKFRTSEYLKDLLVPHVPTWLTPPENVDCLWIMRKPRFGAGSRGIVRLKPSETSAGDHDNWLSVFQPWIQPESASINGAQRYFDIRLYVLDGAIVGAVARCAVAPVGGVAANSELEWLTTLGSVSPIHVGPSVARTSGITIGPDEATLLSNLARQVAERLDEKAALAVQPQEGSQKSFGSLPVLFVSEIGQRNDWSLDDLKFQSSSIAIADISGDAGEWDAVQAFSKWRLMPQLVVGPESFPGSKVIIEAFSSGEVERALTCNRPELNEEELSIDALSEPLETSHRQAIWCGSSSSGGELIATGSADGTVKIRSGDHERIFRFSDRWINALSVSPCGGTLVVGTSGAFALVIDLQGSKPIRMRRLNGHQRWINGVLALCRHRVATISSDGLLVLWKDGGAHIKGQHRTVGHILGMRKGLDGEIYTWASDGSIEVWRSDDLTFCERFQLSASSYVTAVTAVSVRGSRNFVGIDVDGVVHSTQFRAPIAQVGERSWGLIANESTGTIIALTVEGRAFIWRYNQPARPNELRSFLLRGTYPTFAEFISDTRSLMIGYGSGALNIVDL